MHTHTRSRTHTRAVIAMMFGLAVIDGLFMKFNLRSIRRLSRRFCQYRKFAAITRQDSVGLYAFGFFVCVWCAVGRCAASITCDGRAPAGVVCMLAGHLRAPPPLTPAHVHANLIRTEAPPPSPPIYHIYTVNKYHAVLQVDLAGMLRVTSVPVSFSRGIMMMGDIFTAARACVQRAQQQR